MSLSGRLSPRATDPKTRNDGEVVQQKLTSMRQLVNLVNAAQPGDELKLEYYREGDRKDVEIKLGDRPQSDQHRGG